MKMEQLTLQVEGMSCGHCVNAIESSVKELNGVEQVNPPLVYSLFVNHNYILPYPPKVINDFVS
jgi:cation transport ATPase